jgi:hypothetical protein
MPLTDALTRELLIHAPGWCPRSEIDLNDPELLPAVVLDYRRVELHTQVGPDCWSIDTGWQISLRSEDGRILVQHSERYPSGPYPSTDRVKTACLTLVEQWRTTRQHDREMLAAAREWVTTVGNLDGFWQLRHAAEKIEAGTLRPRDVAHVLGVHISEVQTVLDDREYQRYTEQSDRETWGDWATSCL